MSKKISQLSSAADVTASDLFQMVDIEDSAMATSGTNKKITAQLLANELAGIVSNNTMSGAKLVDGTTPSSKLAAITATGSTTARTIENRFSDVVNVKDFGAVGDGIADDLPAFTAANNSGKLVFIPKPSVSYNVSSPIKMDKCAVLIDPNNTSWSALTDNGNISFLRGKQNGLTSPVVEDCNFWRLTDRILMGGMANKWTGASGNAGNAWFANTSDYPAYLGVNAKLSISTSTYSEQTVYGDNPYGISVGVRSNDALQSVIGFGSCVINNRSSTNGWGFIAEIERHSGASGTYGIEVAAKNKGSDVIATPNNVYGGIYGVWLQGGGDKSFSGATVNPVTAGIVFVRGNSGYNRDQASWNTGILFSYDSLTNGEAIAMSSRSAYGQHQINWYGSDGNISSYIKGGNDTADTKVGISFFSNGINFLNNSSKSCFLVSTSANSVNRVQVVSSISSSSPIIEAAGDDTNIDLTIRAKGTGAIRYGTHAAITTETLSGYIEIKDSAGNIRKLAVVS